MDERFLDVNIRGYKISKTSNIARKNLEVLCAQGKTVHADMKCNTYVFRMCSNIYACARNTNPGVMTTGTVFSGSAIAQKQQQQCRSQCSHCLLLSDNLHKCQVHYILEETQWR